MRALRERSRSQTYDKYRNDSNYGDILDFSGLSHDSFFTFRVASDYTTVSFGIRDSFKRMQSSATNASHSSSGSGKGT
jgi:hypothetical protein